MMKSDEENQNDAETWGTWEELLLACAVKRHGFKNWDSVAMELQSKTSLPHLLTTAQCCKQKYHDLKRRFKDEQHENEHEPPPKLVNIPWLEELRKVRVDELKQEVQRYDLNINSLQLKVKRLEEEREPALDIKTTQTKPDLDDRNIVKKDEPEKSEELEKVCKRLVSGEESDRENRSVNESNSTGLSEKIGDGEMIKNEAKTVGSGGGGVGGSKGVESDELGDSVTQLSSDVQSSASFGKKRRRSCGGDSIKGMDVKSEPLMRLLELIRTHKHVSSFERRLKSQESNKYKEMVRQHVDLETIRTRVEQGAYSSCILTFYRDVLLLFNNAIVYFPKSSLESATAFQLRNLFSSEIKKENHKSDSSQDPPPPPPPPPAPAPAPAPLPPQLKPPLLERSDSLLAKHKQSAPIIVCRKRSSVSSKPSTSSTFARQQHQADDKKPSAERSSSLLKVKTEEKAVTTGARSSRRSNRNPTTNTPPPPPPPSKKRQNATSGSKGADPKADKKKSEGSSTLDKKKSVVDFLKRIKKNSPVQPVKNSKGSEEKKKNNNNNNNNNSSSSSSSSSSSGKKDKGKERVLWRSGEKRQSAKEENSPSKRSVGRPPKKTPETSGKRGRETVVVGKRQSKRARR